MADAVFVFHTKPWIRIQDWEALYARYQHNAAQAPSRAAAPFEAAFATGAWGTFLHPSSRQPADFDGAVRAAFAEARALPGLMIRAAELAASFRRALAQEHGVEAEVDAYLLFSELGSVTLLSFVAPAVAPEGPLPTPLEMRALFAEQVLTAHAPAVDAAVAAAAERFLGAEISVSAAGAFSYLVSVYRGEVLDTDALLEVHRLEDGALENQAQALRLSHVGCRYACIGWGNATLFMEPDFNFLYLTTPIVAIDALYSVTTLLSAEAMERSEQAASHRWLSSVKRDIERYQADLLQAEQLGLADRKLEVMFKPWQRLIYRHLSDYWNMASSLELFRRSIDLRLNELKNEQTAMVAELERRRNSILGVIAALEIFGLLGALQAYRDLQADVGVDLAASPGWSWVLANALSGLAVVTLVTLLIYLRPR